MIDAHCHLYELDDIEAEVQRFKDVGGTDLICCGAGAESSRKAVEIAQKYPEVWATVGVHPEESSDVDWEELRKLTRLPKVVAIGECGLDYRDDTAALEKESQKGLLKLNIALAVETKLPLVVHCRSAFDDIFEMVNYPLVQMHCFTGNMEQMQECVKRGWYISFGGIITFKSSHELREVAKMVPEGKLLIETDAPYLAPEPVRGTKNTPANGKIVAETLARLWGKRLEDIDQLTSDNARWLFKLDVTKETA